MARKCTHDGCARPFEARGFCKYHYKVFRKNGGQALRERPTPVRDYIRDTVLTYSGDECLIWPFARNPGGYGSLRTEDGRNRGAHRFICEKAHGPAPTDMHYALHSCGRGHHGCVNPKHIRWGTPSENMADARLHGTLPVGERSGSSKISAEAASEIIRLTGIESRTSLAARFGLTRNHIYYIQSGRSWAHLGGHHA